MNPDKDNQTPQPDKSTEPIFPVDRIELNESIQPSFPTDRIEKGETPCDIVKRDD